MFGAVCGDILGSFYELHCTKDYNFELFSNESRFTDDTVLTFAVCDAILYNPQITKGFFSRQNRAKEYAYRYKQFYKRYPYAGFGQMFQDWANYDILYKQNSFGNGAAMRVVPIGYAYQSLYEVMDQAALSCRYTHNNSEAIKAAQAVAAAVFLANNKKSKDEIKDFLAKKFRYNLDRKISDIQKTFIFDSRADYSVPPAIIAFLESESFEDAVRKAVSLGGDSDTIACIAGGIAEAYYKVIPENVKNFCYNKMDGSFKALMQKFYKRFIGKLEI